MRESAVSAHRLAAISAVVDEDKEAGLAWVGPSFRSGGMPWDAPPCLPLPAGIKRQAAGSDSLLAGSLADDRHARVRRTVDHFVLVGTFVPRCRQGIGTGG